MISQTYERGALALAIVSVAVCLFGPLLIVALLERSDSLAAASHAGEVTVGIGVILRATFRRIFRAAARNFFRTTFSAVTRASARTFTRRLLRFVLRMFFGILAKQTADEGLDTNRALPESTGTLRNPQLSLFGIAISFVALGFSFWGVLLVAGSSTSAAATTGEGLGLTSACLLAAAPILVYAAVTYVLASWLRMGIQFACGLDALLLQAYFTGSGSFLPMTTDIEYYGTKRQNATLAFATIGTMYGAHVGLLQLARATDLYVIEFAAAMFLIYAFVYSFPIAPLEGHEVWTQSKLLWCCVFVPILISFFLSFPAILTPLI